MSSFTNYDALFILADEPKKCPKLAGALRTYLGEELDLIKLIKEFHEEIFED